MYFVSTNVKKKKKAKKKLKIKTMNTEKSVEYSQENVPIV